jgi:cysteine desulfuration protein SufE
MLADINTIQDEIVDEFGFFDNWTDKYEHIIAFAKGLKKLPEEEKTDANLVRGCQSRVWLTSTYENGLMNFRADSEAIITKGLVAVASSDLYFVDKIGLKEHLSPIRANGLLSMIRRMKEQATSYLNSAH